MEIVDVRENYPNAVLISNDHHFNRIREGGIIKVWTTEEAIKRLPENQQELNSVSKS